MLSNRGSSSHEDGYPKKKITLVLAGIYLYLATPNNKC